MNGKELGNEIRNGMKVMGGDIKLAGKIRNAQLVARQGYVALTRPEAVAAFHANPEYMDWSCKVVDGEYRFYPPADKKTMLLELLNKYNKNESISAESIQRSETLANQTNLTVAWDTNQVLDTYKRAIADSSKTTFVSVTTLPDDHTKCIYRLTSTDRSSGEKTIVQEFVTDFEGKFAMELLPSIYNQVMGGLPVVDSEKGENDKRTIKFESMEGNRVMAFGNLNARQLSVVKGMKEYVDGIYFNLAGEKENKGKAERTAQHNSAPTSKTNLAAAWDTNQVLDTYKRAIADSSKTTFVSVTTLPDNHTKCIYRLTSTDRSSGEKTIVQEFVTDFEGKFAMELLPSIYNQVMGGLPVIDTERGEGENRAIKFDSMEDGRTMAFGNLNASQLSLVKSMKAFVDGQYFSTGEEAKKGVHK